MNTWRYAAIDEPCGFCRDRIQPGDTELELVLAGRRDVRCQPCGERLLGAPAPDVIAGPAADEPRTSLAPQPSLGFEDVRTLASAAITPHELARRRTANHLRQRGRR